MPASLVPNNTQDERRVKPRLACNFPAVIRAHTRDSTLSQIKATVINISASGMYLSTQRHIQRGAIIFLITRFSNFKQGKNTVPVIAAVAEVVRVTTKPNGEYGLGLRIRRFRFL